MILTDIKRVDYINLIVAQISEGLSSELQYLLTEKQFQEMKNNYELTSSGKKIKTVCRTVSQALRKIGKD